MAYTNSPLVSYTKLSPNHSGQRTHSIDRITPHCVVGQCSVETLGNIFLPTSRQASSNYGIGVDGRVGMYVEEKNRSWCSSSAANDQRAITIECASDNFEPYAFKDVVYKRLVELCTDICKRNGIQRLNFTGDKTGNLTMHCYFKSTLCPGPYLKSKFPYIASEVNKRLGAEAAAPEPFIVQITASSLNVRKGPGTSYAVAQTVSKGQVFTIVQQQGGWGKLKSGAGWISLKYTARK